MNCYSNCKEVERPPCHNPPTLVTGNARHGGKGQAWEWKRCSNVKRLSLSAPPACGILYRRSMNDFTFIV